MPETISDGNNALLVNGFWGISRHINYVRRNINGVRYYSLHRISDVDLAMVISVILCVLLFMRQSDDDKRCELKYGQLWKTYTTKVPYRIIPFIY